MNSIDQTIPVTVGEEEPFYMDYIETHFWVVTTGFVLMQCSFLGLGVSTNSWVYALLSMFSTTLFSFYYIRIAKNILNDPEASENDDL